MLSKEQSDKLAKLQKKEPKKQVQQRDTFHVKIPDFVAIDLETTGLNRREDRITEIGMVKYIGGVEVERYSTLVNPMRPIPPYIVRLTGITDEMVAPEPLFSEVMEDVVRFIGRLAICAHRVDFDFNFLNAELERNGQKRLRNWQIDTLSTSRVVLHLEEGYALGKVARALNIKLESAHRALDDAKACGEIALKILPMLGELPSMTRKQLAAFAPFSFTKKILESSVRNVKSQKVKRELPPIGTPITPQNKSFTLADEAVAALYRADGPLGSELRAYQEREQQIAYATDVASALNEQKLVAVEAGTGTGKSLGYSLPAAQWALERGQRVVISTNTKNLQDQLARKELPLVQKVVGKELRFAVLKGRGNYLCIKGWESFLRGETGAVSAREREAVMPLIGWVNSTTSGDIEEHPSFNPGFNRPIWQHISAESKNCSGCQFYSECFMQRARKRALASHIVVINHSLLFSDLIASSDFIGEAGALIVDEAHHLEATGHRTLQVEIDTRRLLSLVDYAQETLNSFKSISDKSGEDVLKHATSNFKKVVRRLRKNGEEFLSDITTWCLKHSGDAEEVNNNIATISYKEKPFRASGGLAGLRIALTDLIDQVSYIRQVAATELEESVLKGDLRSVDEMASQFRADLNYLANADTDEAIFWMALPVERPKWVKLTGATLDVDSFLASFWQQFGKPVVLTSATLSPRQKMSYFLKRIGAPEETASTSYPPLFGADNAQFLALTDTPEPSDPNYHLLVADALEELKVHVKKNILVLFTNNQFLRDVYEELANRESVGPHEVFAQRISGNRVWIQEQMNDVEGAILLGSGSFWEGVDMPGTGCEIVVIPRLPFPVPSHPLSKALADRAEVDGRNGFIDYFLPEALLRFKQGAGRLIRHHDDRGALIVMDSRLSTKNYGKQFAKLMPQECQQIASQQLIPTVKAFFDGAQS